MKKRYVTRGIADEVPDWLQNLMWYLRDSIEGERDYLQIFRLTRSLGVQIVTHEQEQPPYKKVVMVPCDNPLDAKIYVIEDADHVTMLLADEY